MAPGELIEIDAAREAVLARAVPLEAEAVTAREALGRVLAQPVRSAEPVPGFDNSAMDGFAIRAANTRGAGHRAPAKLALVGESAAGHPAEVAVGDGEAIAISTGAMLPDGADAVVRVEDTRPAEGRVEVLVEVEPGRDIRRAGEDIAAGETVIEPGAEIGAAEAGVIASVGLAEVSCARRPRVAVLSTGDELQEPGEALRPGAIRNSNAHSLPPLATAAGAEVISVEMVPDERGATEAALERAIAAADVIVVSGGVSVGPHDHVRPTLAQLGVDEVFWGVALRPGKPTWFGTTPPRSSASRPVSAGLVFGLPGNPVSAMVTFHLFVRPALRRMLGAAETTRTASATLDVDYPKQPGRAHLVRCRLELRDDGWHATPTKAQGSHILTSMLDADALAVIPTDSDGVSAGERVEIELL